MIWAAAIDASLSLVGDGALGAQPVGVLLAAAAAVAIEFGVLRGAPEPPAAPAAERRRPFGRLA